MVVRGLEPGKRPALIVMECQNGITNPDYSDSPLVQQVVERGIIARINTLAAKFRTHGLPVIHCHITARTGFAGWNENCLLANRIRKDEQLLEHSAAGAANDDLVVDPSDIVSNRHHGMAPFTGTDVNATLRGFGIDTVVLSGVSTNVALFGAAIEGVGHGYTMVLAEDAAAGGTPETHRVQVTMHFPLIATVASSSAVIGALAGKP